ncbi:hypothetical protein BH24ACT5_BH24ACT5_19710 [soil metagenome]
MSATPIEAPPGHLHPVQVRHRRPATYIAADTLDHAVQLLAAEPGTSRVIAGGSDLLLEIERGVRRGITTVIDISRTPGAGMIRVDPVNANGVRVNAGVGHLGPMVTHADVVGSDALNTGALPLAQACYELASPQLRNRATVAGNIVTASPANDTISALLALGADVTLRSSRGERTMPVVDFITGFRTTQLADDEVVVDIAAPLLGAHRRGVFVKLGNRSAQAISVVHLAAVVEFADDGRTVDSARLAIGSVAPTVVLADDAADALVGQPLDDSSIDAAAEAAAEFVRPIADIRATAEYRSATVAVMVRRALQVLATGRQRERWPADSPRLSRRLRPPAAPSHVVTDDDPIVVEVNGKSCTAPGAAGATLLDWIRERAGLTGTKEGCAEGECGACTVILDGAAVMSCLVPAARADGASVTTVEGLADTDSMHPVQSAFVACDAVQCGYCTPGFVVAGAALLAEHPVPTGEQIRQGLAGNLCRCTGYGAIVEAIEQASGKPA